MEKKELEEKIQELKSRLANPEAFHLDINQIKDMEEKLDSLLEEYAKLPEETIERGELEVQTETIYKTNLFNMKKSNNGWYAVEDATTNVRTKIICDSDGKAIRALRTVRNSDTYGKPVTYAYDLVYVKPETQIPAKTIEPCSKLEEGKALIENKNIDWLMQTWNCPRCHMDVLNGFDICPNCTTARPKEEKKKETKKKKGWLF